MTIAGQPGQRFGQPLGPAIEQIPAADIETTDCDLCAARARVYVTFTDTNGALALLTFCQHHARDVHDGITAKHPDATFTGDTTC